MAEVVLEGTQARNTSRTKFLVGGFVILLAVGYLIVSSFGSSAQFFLTVEELRAKGTSIIGDDVRISGVVDGDSITYDTESLRLEFNVVDDLMQHEAQAIIEGAWQEDGVFYAHNRADSLLLKCPTRYEEEFPEQIEG
jgi:cytochrome c-type biogenesis protein CcmE